MTQMLPKPIYRNGCSTMGSFARLSLELRSNTKRPLLLRKRGPKRAFLTSIILLGAGLDGSLPPIAALLPNLIGGFGLGLQSLI
jgi:hypothetical protein